MDLLGEPVHFPCRSIVGHLAPGHHPQVLLVRWAEAELVESHHREDHQERELGEVTQSWLEMVTVAKLKRMPALNGSIKHQTWK